MFDYVLNTLLSLIANEIWVDKELVYLIPMKSEQNLKAFLNGTD